VTPWLFEIRDIVLAMTTELLARPNLRASDRRRAERLAERVRAWRFIYA
jgi:hypothetical protein